MVRTIGTNLSEVINSGIATDVLFGRAGNDTLNGCPGNDTLWGEDGTDALHVTGGTKFLYDELRDGKLSSVDANSIMHGGGAVFPHRRLLPALIRRQRPSR